MTAEKVASHIQKEMERTLRVLCAEHGARFNGVRVDFTDDKVTGRFAVALDVESGMDIEEVEPEGYKAMARRLGIPTETWGMVFTDFGTEYRVTGLTPRWRKYPVDVVRSTDGKPFKFTAAIIVAAAAGEGK